MKLLTKRNGLLLAAGLTISSILAFSARSNPEKNKPEPRPKPKTFVQKDTPMEWVFERDGMDKFVLLDFRTPQQKKVTPDAEIKKVMDKAHADLQKLYSVKDKFDEKAAREILDKLLKDYPKHGRTAQMYNDFASQMENRKASKEKLVEIYRKMSEYFPQWSWQACYRLQRITDTQLYFYNYGRTQVEPGKEPQINMYTHNLSEVQMTVYKVDLHSMVKAGIPLQAPSLPEDAKLIKQWTYKVEKKNRRWYNQRVSIPVKKTGAYLVNMATEHYSFNTMVMVSDIALLTQNDSRLLLAHATNVRGGKVPGKMDVMVQDNHRLIYSGKTNKEGVFGGKIQGQGKNALVVVKRGDSYAVAYSRWGGYWGGQPRVLTYTDRPVYRPSQDVQIKVIGRRHDSKKNEYVFKKGDKVTVTIRDPKYNEALKKTVELNEFGTATLTYSLAEEPPLGNYYIQVSGSGFYSYSQFEVKEYKKPEYEVSVKMSSQKAVIGDVVDVDVSAKYFFGEVVKNADVKYEIYARPYYYYYPWYRYRYSGYSWMLDDYYQPRRSYYGGPTKVGKGKLDENGKFTIAIDTNKLGLKKNQYYYQLDIRASVTDKSRRQIQGYGSVRLGHSAVVLAMSPRRWGYRPGDKVNIDVRCVDLMNKPVMTDVTCEVRLRDKDNAYTKQFSDTIKVEKNGTAHYSFVPDVKGDFQIVCTTKDDKGRQVQASCHIWVIDETWNPNYAYSGLDIKLDKDLYTPGEKAQVIATTGHKDHSVLVTTSGNQILSYKLKRFKGGVLSYDEDVRKEFSPNVTMRFTMFAGGQYVNREKRMIVPAQEKLINVSIQPDKGQYKPGEAAAYLVKLTDHKGNPIQAEISFGLVDEAIYAMSKDKTPDIRKLFYGGRNVYIYPQLSFNFRAQGIAGGARAQREVANMRRGGMPKPSAPAMKMAKEEAEASMDMADDKVMLGKSMGRKKKDSSKALVAARVRKNFKDSAVWHAQLKTDAKGEAVIRFKMPDNLTTWRAKVIAIDGTARVGQETHKVITRQQLMLRLQTPRTFTEGDRVTVSAVIHNYLPTAKSCVIRFKHEGGDLVAGSKETKIHLSPGKDKRVDWVMQIDTHKPVKVEAAALTDEESDAMELVVPVVPYGLKVVNGDGGLAESATLVSLDLPGQANIDSATMRISMSPSLAATMFDGLEYLTGFPYGCVEQTMSRFLPNIVVTQTLQKLSIENAKLTADLGKYTSKGLQRLYSFQHGDGGWGWWKQDKTNPYMTAYVVYGLCEARKADYAVDQNVINRAIKYLDGAIGGEKNLDTKAYMVYAYAQAKKPKAEWTKALYEKREKINDFGVSMLLLTAKKSGQKDRVAPLLKELESRVAKAGALAWWGDKNHYKHWASNQIQTTAYALRALVAVNPKHELIGKTINYLVRKRRGQYWNSTKDTAAAIFGLSDYVAVSNELNPDYTADLLVNGKVVKTIKVKGDAMKQKPTVVTLEGKDLRKGENKVEFRKRGEGNLYYACSMQHFSQGKELTEGMSNGLAVKREYFKLVDRGKDGKVSYKREPLRGEVKSGDEIEVRLTVTSNAVSEYIMLEDMLPAGCEIVEDKSDIDNRYRYWWYYCNNREARDEKMVFFNSYLRKGSHTFVYTIRAETPGHFEVMPARAEAMYMPELNGSSPKTKMSIFEK